MPIERAEPSIRSIAFSMSLAFKSFILAWAISRTWARVTLPAGADRFADGEKWLRELIDGARVDDEVGRRGSGLVAFGSFTFDDASDGSVLIVPRAILGRDGTGNAWLTTITPEGETPWQRAPFDPPEPPDIVSRHD